jgi:hypothetical protein
MGVVVQPWASREIEIGPTGPSWWRHAAAAVAAPANAPVQGAPAPGVYALDTLDMGATLTDKLRSTILSHKRNVLRRWCMKSWKRFVSYE